MGERQEERLARLEAGLNEFMKEKRLPIIPFKMKGEKSTQTEARPRTTADQ
jgi:CRISPR/Cas system-associated endoribonuclease Cas2